MFLKWKQAQKQRFSSNILLVEMFALSPEDSNSYFQRHGAKLIESSQRALLGYLVGSVPCK